MIILPRSSPRWHKLVYKWEKRRNLYLLPSYLSRLLALPYYDRTATQKPTLVYETTTIGVLSDAESKTNVGVNISTGIYRCSILDHSMKFCENFDKSRISADKRFSLCLHPATQNPDRASAERSATAKLIILVGFEAIIHRNVV